MSTWQRMQQSVAERGHWPALASVEDDCGLRGSDTRSLLPNAGNVWPGRQKIDFVSCRWQTWCWLLGRRMLGTGGNSRSTLLIEEHWCRSYGEHRCFTEQNFIVEFLSILKLKFAELKIAEFWPHPDKCEFHM